MASARRTEKRGRAEAPGETAAKRNEDTIALSKERSEEETMRRAMQARHAKAGVPTFVVLQIPLLRLPKHVDLDKENIRTLLSDFKHAWVFTGSGTLAGYVSHTSAQHTTDSKAKFTDIVGRLRLFPATSTDIQQTIDNFTEMLTVIDTTEQKGAVVPFALFLAVDSKEYRYYCESFVPCTLDLSQTPQGMQKFFSAHTNSTRLRGMPIVQALTRVSNANKDTASAFKLAGFVHSVRRSTRVANGGAGAPETFLEMVCLLYYDLPDTPLATLETFTDDTWTLATDGPPEPPALRLAHYLCLHNTEPLKRIVWPKKP